MRAGRRAGQQAPPRHGLCAHPLSATSRSWARSPIRTARRGLGRAGEDRVRRPDAVERDAHVILSPRQRELAAGLGRDDARRGARLRRERTRATLITPFILAGAMAPVTVAGGRHPDARRGARGHGVRAARPAGHAGDLRLVRLARCRCSRARRRSAPRSPALVLYVMAAARPAAGRPVPLRRQPVRVQGCPMRRPPTSSADTFKATMLAGTNFVLHAAGWLEGGLAVGYEKFILDEDQCGMAVDVREGRRPVRERPGARRDARRTAPGTHFLGHPHTLRNFETAFYRSRPPTTTASSSGWRQGAPGRGRSGPTRSGSGRSRSTRRRRSTRASTRRSLDYIARRKASFPDSDV